MLKIFRIASVILLLAWMFMIFSLSAQTADDSSNTSGSIIATFIKLFYPDFEELSKAEQNNLIEPFQFIVRKGAHFMAYAILGLLAFLSVVTYESLLLRWQVLISLAVCLLYSVSDELHQLFVPGRSGEIRDVCIDLCGSMLAIFILSFIKLRINRKRAVFT